jgi:hypothetical protein
MSAPPAVTSVHVASLTSEKPRPANYAERFARQRDLLAFRVSELRAAQEARSIVEKRYLDGHGALFPDVAAAWDEQVKSTGEIADMAVRLAELDGVLAARPSDPETLSQRTPELVDDLVEPAKAEVLQKLGEGERALSIANAWVRTQMQSRAVALKP